MSWLSDMLNLIWHEQLKLEKAEEITHSKIDKVLAKEEAILTAQASLAAQVLQNSKDIQTVLETLKFLIPPPAVGFKITYIGADMTGKVVKATVDFQLLDNGTAKATLTPIDSVGNVTSMPAGASVPAWASSDPAVAVAAEPDGLSATLTPSGSLATGVVITADSTLADGTTHITGQGDPIDVVAGPAASFKIVEA